jgi:protein TonB
VFDLTRDIRFKYALVFTLVAHLFVFYKPIQSKTIQRASLSVAKSAQSLRVSFVKRTPKKPVIKKKKKKISKLARKKVEKPKKEKIIEQKIEKVASAIMKTVFNSKANYTPTPRYPRRAQRRGIEGKVLVSIMIAKDGSASSAKILESSGHEILDNAALKAALEWKFSPAIVNGVTVESTNTQSFVFSLQNI